MLKPRRALVFTAVGATVLVWLVLSATAALADEFTVGILVDAPDSEPADSNFMEGFQIAVDQSPDVSHPAGIEGGDHLGSIDVVLVVANGAGSQAEVLNIVAEMVDRRRIAILVVDLSTDAVETLLGPLAEANIMLISMSGNGDGVFPATPSFFDAADSESPRALLTDRTPTFEDTYAAIHNRPPPPSAVRGYIAGRLVDIAVEATNRDPFDVSTLAEALADAGALGSSELRAVGADDGTAVGTPGTSLLQPEGQGTPAWLVGGIATAIAALMIGAAGLVRRSRPPTEVDTRRDSGL